MSHYKIPLFFCVTIFLMQMFDIWSTMMCLSLGYEEMNPLFSHPVTLIKLSLAVIYYAIYIFAENICNQTEFKTFMKVYRNGFYVYVVIYSIILINNFSVLIGR